MLQLNVHQRFVLFHNQISARFSDPNTRTVTQYKHECTYTSTTVQTNGRRAFSVVTVSDPRIQHSEYIPLRELQNQIKQRA
jgi:hypothetical protein